MTVTDNIREATVRKRPNAIQLRQLDASRCVLLSMESEVAHHDMKFTRTQRRAMRKTVRALRELIAALDDDRV